ncbi:MAG: TonB-dependent receptor [Bacteroides sp.]|nr:TonB-dependent receptor [Bacteroides sp.]MCM1379509.1 TonB-dependent receptor [Bacteroides sp.]MCM1445888.1 TonB-dependent receptor [Prevotella sp.]
MKKIALFLVASLVCFVSAMAQTRTITGRVVSEADDEPLIGATVLPLPSGSGQGTATDVDGNFSITVPERCTELQVSYIGMTTRTVRITTGSMLIKLSDHANRLDEVMVVAYGTAKRAEFTGSASVVKADEIADALVSSVTSALSGKVAGVQVQSSDGRPGSSPNIRIRGVGSINASASPLYVVDGVPYDGSISDLASSDIESMTVLKDAASTALYGARGANGVILVTTKRGASGQAKVTFDARWGANQRQMPNYNVIKSTGQYMELVYEGLYNQNMATGKYTATDAWRSAAQSALTATGYQIYTVPTGEYLIGRNGRLNPNATLGYSDGEYFYTPDDWTDNTIRNGLRQEYNLSVSGGTDRIKYYLSGSYLGDEGIIRESNFNRFSTRATVDYQAFKWLKIGTNLAYTYTDANRPSDMDLDYATSAGNAFFIANQIAPVYPMFVRGVDGKIMTDPATGKKVYDYGDRYSTNFARSWMSQANPIGNLVYDTNKYLSDVFDGKWYATITPIEGLTITGNAGYWLSNDRVHLIGNPYYGQAAESKGFAEQYFARSRSINLQAIATYTHTFNLVHNIDVMAGYETYNLENEGAAAYGYNLYDPNSWAADNTIDQRDGSGDRTIQYTTRGILARAKYNYDSKYFFHASYRRDASSRFAPDHRWGNFFSVSAAWDVAKERFMDNVTWLDQLKVKFSFGQNGNDNLGAETYYYYADKDQYQITGADGVWNDATLVYKGNKDITWETSNALNAGIDFSLFQGKLDGTIEYYQRQVSDMLFFLPTAPSLGYSSYPANVGSMRNYGVEIELNYNVFNTRNFTWDINANLTSMGNKIIKLPKELIADGYWLSGSRIFKEGKSMYQYYLPAYAGVDEKTGEALYWAKQTDGTEVKTNIYTDAYNGNPDKGLVENRKESGNMLPKVYGGFGTSLNFYGVDFSISFAYQIGGRIYDSTYQELMHNAQARNIGANYHVDILNRWTPENTHTEVPRINSGDSYSASSSDRFYISSNYLSLNNITLGYTLPSKITRKIGIDAIRFYAAAENVALWSKRRGLDPRQGFATSNNSTYSPIRAICGGIRVQF